MRVPSHQVLVKFSLGDHPPQLPPQRVGQGGVGSSQTEVQVGRALELVEIGMKCTHGGLGAKGSTSDLNFEAAQDPVSWGSTDIK